MYQLIPLYSCDYLQKTSIKINMGTDKGKQPKWNVTLNKQWNWSGFTKLAMSASWTHDLIALSVRASEQNSVVVSSNPTNPSKNPSLPTSKWQTWLLPFYCDLYYFLRDRKSVTSLDISSLQPLHLFQILYRF